MRGIAGGPADLGTEVSQLMVLLREARLEALQFLVLLRQTGLEALQFLVLVGEAGLEGLTVRTVGGFPHHTIEDTPTTKTIPGSYTGERLPG